MPSHLPPNTELEYVWTYLVESLLRLAFRHPPG